jgi:DNA-binding CsgD family transcriptional regulator
MTDSPSVIPHIQKAGLSSRKTEVLQQVKQGLTCKEISKNLVIGLETVKTHRKRIISKLGIIGKTEFRRFILELLIDEKT